MKTPHNIDVPGVVLGALTPRYYDKLSLEEAMKVDACFTEALDRERAAYLIVTTRNGA